MRASPVPFLPKCVYRPAYFVYELANGCLHGHENNHEWHMYVHQQCSKLGCDLERCTNARRRGVHQRAWGDIASQGSRSQSMTRAGEFNDNTFTCVLHRNQCPCARKFPPTLKSCISYYSKHGNKTLFVRGSLEVFVRCIS